MNPSRRGLLHLAVALPALTLAGRLFAAPARLAALSAGVPARRVRLRQLSSPLLEQLLLRGPPAHRDRAPGGECAERRSRTRCRTGRLPRPCAIRLRPLYQRASVARFMPFAGTDDLSRSHFETQDSIELGSLCRVRAISAPALWHGWCSSHGASAPIAFTDSLPLASEGAADIPNVSLKGVGKPAFDARQSSLLTVCTRAITCRPQLPMAWSCARKLRWPWPRR